MTQNLTFRPLNEADKMQVTQWVKEDSEHQTADPGTWTDTLPGRSNFVVEDKDGPVYYVTVENVARMHIQFNPHGSKVKTAKALILGFKWLLANLKDRGYWELIFDSRFPSLIKFCGSAFGFTKSERDYSTRL